MLTINTSFFCLNSLPTKPTYNYSDDLSEGSGDEVDSSLERALPVLKKYFIERLEKILERVAKANGHSTYEPYSQVGEKKRKKEKKQVLLASLGL